MIRPLQRDAEAGTWTSSDSRWKFVLQTAGSPPLRWWAYADNAEHPANGALVHRTLGEVADWASRQVLA